MSGEPVRVCPATELGDGDRELVEVGGTEVGVFRVDGEYHAMANHCPHRGGPLCEGDVVPALVAEWKTVGERTEKRAVGDPSITCPWHGWEFDLATGEHLGDDSVVVPTYEVFEEDGDLYVRR